MNVLNWFLTCRKTSELIICHSPIRRKISKTNLIQLVLNKVTFDIKKVNFSCTNNMSKYSKLLSRKNDELFKFQTLEKS